jgi:hypothetical protein
MIDTEKVTQAILDAPVSPTAREAASPLVDAYLEALEGFPDTACETVAVEVPWRLWLDEKTLIVGVMDRIARDDEPGFFGHEHKTKGAPKLKKDGTPYKGSSEQDWLDEISQGVQVGIYALALQDADFIDKGGTRRFARVDMPRMLVRVCIKSDPPVFWPVDPSRGIFSFEAAYLDSIRAALLSKAAQIRAARALSRLVNEFSGREVVMPWQLPGVHCTNKYQRECGFLKLCRERITPTGPAPHAFDPSNPAYPALEGLELGPDTVVLSASSYGDYAQCMELGRIISGGYFPKKADIALQVGTTYHNALANIYTQLMEKA